MNLRRRVKSNHSKNQIDSIDIVHSTQCVEKEKQLDDDQNRNNPLHLCLPSWSIPKANSPQKTDGTTNSSLPLTPKKAIQPTAADGSAALPDLTSAGSNEDISDAQSASSPVGKEIKFEQNLSAPASPLSNSPKIEGDQTPPPPPPPGSPPPRAVIHRVDGNTITTPSYCSSVSSLLSAYSYEDEESTIASRYQGVARLIKHHEERDRRLRRILLGKRHLYEMSLMQQEHAVRRWSVQQEQRRASVKSTTKRTTETDQDDTNDSTCKEQTGLPTNLWWHNNILFEQHSLNACAVILSYTLANAPFYFLIDIFLGKMIVTTGVSPEVFYTAACLLGFLVMRFSGYLWIWLDKESYNLVKFEMHNRESLGYTDARVSRRLRGTKTRFMLNMVSFYAVYASLVNLYSLAIDKLAFQPLMKYWYQPIEAQVKAMWLQDGNEDYEGMIVTCDLFAQYLPNDTLAHRMCLDVEWVSVQTAFHLVVWMGAVTVYGKLGHKFIECCG